MKNILVLFLILFSFGAIAQVFAPPIKHYSQKDYGALQAPYNYCIEQDDNGIMYFGNVGAILTFNGQEWDTITTIKSVPVVSLSKNEYGTLFAGAINDFGILVPRKNGKLKFKSLRHLIAEEIEFQQVWNINCHKNQVYFQSEEGLFIYDIVTQQITTILPEVSFHTGYLIDGDYFIRQRKKGIQQVVGSELKTVKGSEPFEVYGMFGIFGTSQSNAKKLITQEIGVWDFDKTEINPSYLMDIEKNEFGIVDQALINKRIIGGHQLKNGNIILYSQVSGITEIDFSGRIVRELNKESGLKTNVVNAVFESKNGTVWLALSNGINQINYNDPISTYGEKNGIYGSINSIVSNEYEVFVGTDEGVFSKSVNARSFTALNLPKIKVNSLYLDGDKLYVGTSAVLLEVDLFTLEFTVISNWPTNAMYFDKVNDRIVLAGDQGVQVLTYSEKKIFETIEQKISTALSIEKSPTPIDCDYEYWIGAMNGAFRLSYLDDFGFISHYGEMAGIKEGVAKPFMLGNDLVFGSNEGLLTFIDKYKVAKLANVEVKDSEGYFDEYQFKNGHIATNQFTSGGGVSYQNKIWIGGEITAMEIVDGQLNQNIYKPFKNRIEGIINTIYIDDELLYFGTSEGLVTYKYKQENIAPPSYKTIINKLVYNNKDTILGGAFYSNESTFDFKYKNNELLFEVCAPVFEANDNVYFRYKLEGEEKREWSQWSKNPNIRLTGLWEGSYTIRIESKTDAIILGEPVVFSFEITPPWYRTWWAYTLFVLAGIGIIYGAAKISAYRLQEKNRELEGIVAERTQEISQQRDEILHQKEEIEDSINYAVRIQEAILPFDDDIRKSFAEYFILFKPKDIVSGDFYWHAKKDHYHILVCADCTGHGVPGAFMSMVGSDKLTHAVAEYGLHQPNDLLSFVNQGIKNALKQDETSENATRDGMDVAIVTYDEKNHKLYYSGANRSLMILENNEVEEIKATKVAVGGFTPMDQEFELHELEITPGRTFYMSTDGYADQFGGERGKKLKVKAMKKVIIENGEKSMDEQRQVLDETIENWMNGYSEPHEQIDDICVIGIRFR